MIRNVVFDMGNVLLDFPTRSAVNSVAESGEEAALLHREVFESPWWVRIDRGGDVETSLNGMLRALPEGLHEKARRLMETWTDWLFPTPVNDLIPQLRANGYGTYLLSNTSEQFQQFREKAPAIGQMDGIVLSCEEKLLKPDPALYRRLFDRYGLNAEECFFIDDNPLNIECARWLGMEGFWYQGDAAALKEELTQQGVRL